MNTSNQRISSALLGELSDNNGYFSSSGPRGQISITQTDRDIYTVEYACNDPRNNIASGCMTKAKFDKQNIDNATKLFIEWSAYI